MKKRFEKMDFNNKLTLIGLLISIIALYLSYSSYSYNVNKDKTYNMEVIDTILTSIGTEHAPQYKKHIDPLLDSSSEIPQYYNIIVSNNSHTKSSIVDCKVFQIVNGEKVYFSNLVEGIYINEKEQQMINFPFTLDAGESMSISLKLNFFINKSVDEIIQKKYSYDTRIVFNDLKKYLYENNKDIYGNDIEVQFYDDNTYLATTKNSAGEYPVYLVEFTTSKSNKFRKIIGINNITSN